MGTRSVKGLLRRTPKFLSPLSSSRMKTPMWTRPAPAAKDTLGVKTGLGGCPGGVEPLTGIGAGFVEEEQNGDQHVQNVAALQHEEEEFLRKHAGVSIITLVRLALAF